VAQMSDGSVWVPAARSRDLQGRQPGPDSPPAAGPCLGEDGGPRPSTPTARWR
jgi:hypothetical protein